MSAYRLIERVVSSAQMALSLQRAAMRPCVVVARKRPVGGGIVGRFARADERGAASTFGKVTSGSATDQSSAHDGDIKSGHQPRLGLISRG